MIFLRPWFLVLLLIPFVFHVFREKGAFASSWGKVIDEKLLPYLLVKGTDTTAKRRSVFKIILWSVLVVALSGPAWDKIKVQTQTTAPGTVIILEVSDIMQGSQLQRAEQKIYDLLDRLKEEEVGFVLYDKFGYTAGPLTFEKDIIREMLPYVNQSVLPVQASEPSAAFDQANQLLTNAGIKKGRVIFLTSGVYVPADFAQTVKEYPHQIAVLGIGGELAQPIALESGGFLMGRDGKPFMFKLDGKKLAGLGAYQPMSADDTDIQALLEATPNKPGAERGIDESHFWQDRGGMIAALTLPFFAFLFRRGVAFLFLLMFCVPAMASPWLRPDQEVYREQMKGVRLYRAEKYVEAADIFKTGTTDEDKYNLGNALAFQQKIQEAIDTYKAVIAQNPKHEDAIFNKEYLEKKLKEQEEKKKQQEEQKKQDQMQQKKLEELLKLQEMMEQEKEKKKEEAKELEKQQQKMEEKKKQKEEQKKLEEEKKKKEEEKLQPEKEFLEQLKQEVKAEIKAKEEEKQKIEEIKKKNKEEQKAALQELEKKVEKEQARQEEVKTEIEKKYQLDEVKQKIDEIVQKKAEIKDEVKKAVQEEVKEETIKEIEKQLKEEQKKHEEKLDLIEKRLEKINPKTEPEYLEELKKEVKAEIKAKEEEKQKIEEIKDKNKEDQKAALQELEKKVEKEQARQEEVKTEIEKKYQLDEVKQKINEIMQKKEEIKNEVKKAVQEEVKEETIKEIEKQLKEEQKKHEEKLDLIEKRLEEVKPQAEPDLKKVEQEIQKEIKEKEKAQKEIDDIKAKEEAEQVEKLEQLKEQFEKEKQAEQERYEEFKRQEMEEVADKSEEVVKIQEEIIEKIEEITQSQEEQSEPDKPQEENVDDHEKKNTFDLNKEGNRKEIQPVKQDKGDSVFDQKSQEILNHLEIPEYNVLKYRIYKQYGRKIQEEQK